MNFKIKPFLVYSTLKNIIYFQMNQSSIGFGKVMKAVAFCLAFVSKFDSPTYVNQFWLKTCVSE
jgi:hypothetical protein